MRLRISLLAGVLAALLTVTAVADAHTLSQSAARSKARQAARNIYLGLDLGDDLVQTGYGVGSCSRRSAHAFDCRYWITADGDYDTVRCDSMIRVRFVSSYSYRTTYSFVGEPNCYDV